jgi:CelD/BcsL family acetyltransferase involved in cellulose biosynthesis
VTPAGDAAALYMEQPAEHREGSNADLIERWRALAVESGEAFLLPEWFHAWVHFYGGRPEIVTSRGSDGRLAGVAPLLRSGRALHFAGTGLGGRFGLAAPGEEEDHLAGAIASVIGPREFLVLDHIPAGATWPSVIRARAPRRLQLAVARRDRSWAIELEGASWEDYLATRSRSFRKQLRRGSRRLERDHDLRFRRTSAEDDLDRDMDLLFELHDSRWRDRGGSSIASLRARAFHRDFASAMLDRGWLRLCFLEVDGEAVAVDYGWCIGGRYSSYQAGFSERYANRGVGFLVLASAIRGAINEGAREFDLLRGDESYKARYGTSRRETETLVLAPAISEAHVMARVEGGARRAVESVPALRPAGRWCRRLVDRRRPTTTS